MSLPEDVEDILSDDYEEGEILEEDHLYEDVSSSELEEPEPEARVEVVDLTENCGDERVAKRQRKKEHKCKEDSVCRRERKGKHCYARIRKARRLSSSSRSKGVDPPELHPGEKGLSRKDEEPMHFKRISEKSRLFSPPPRIRMDYVKSHKHDKDYHEKENRYSNKRSWKSNDKFSKSKPKYFYKDTSRSKDYKSKSISSNTALALYRSHVECDSDSNLGKTSLLKRLVGSGITGVKSLKDNETDVGSDGPTEESNSTEPPKPPSLDGNQATESNTALEAKSESNVNQTSDDPKNQNSSENTEPKKKCIELVWKRSIKDDKDELHLRVEALKSAWIKKFSDRKRKGLINKKSKNADDSLADFILDSDSDEDDQTEEVQNDTSANSNAADASGDIVKAEDMVLAADISHDEPIVYEPALQVGAPSDNDSSVFIPSTLISLPNSNSTIALNNTALSVPNAPTTEGKENIDTPPKHNVRSIKTHKSANSRSPRKRYNDRHDKRKRNRRPKKKVKKEVSRKSFSSSKELDEERILRENALMSIKNKPKSNVALPNALPVEELKVNTTLQNSKKAAIVSPMGSSVSQFSSENKPKDKKLAGLCESEGAGATSSDNLDDDIDEDILRAQLLSSLTKQVTQNVDSVVNNVPVGPSLKPVGVKKVIVKKRIKANNKKLWKSNLASLEKKIIENGKLITKNKIRVNQLLKKPQVQEPRVNPPAPVTSEPDIPIPQVAKMIISLNDSDSSSEEESEEEAPQSAPPPLPVPPPLQDLEANIDLLLQEAQQNSLLEKMAAFSISPPPKNSAKKDNTLLGSEESAKAEEVGEEVRNPNVTVIQPKTSVAPQPGTPQALSHLPAWQQEEYRRLKKKIAEKEKILLEVSRVKGNEINELNRLKGVHRDDSNQGKGSEPSTSEVTPKESDEASKTVSKSETEGVSKTAPEAADAPKTPSKSEAGSPLKISEGGGQSKVTESAPSLSVSESSSSQESLMASPKVPKKQTTHASEENSSHPEKKPFSNIISCSVLEEINVMNDVVNEFDKNSSEFKELSRKFNKLQRALKWTEAKMTEKEKKLSEIKDNIKKKDRMICSKIDSLSIAQKPPVSDKAGSREMELIKLKYKEVSLRAQFLFHSVTSLPKEPHGKVVAPRVKEDGRPLGGGVKRAADKPSEAPQTKKPIPLVEKEKLLPEVQTKRNFSCKERERGDWDPNTPVCHFDLNGICKDQECKYQHFKTD